MRNFLILQVVCGASLLAGGCGPVEYLSQVTHKAASAVEEARSIDAQRYAPYEWYAAVEYLHKAREMAGVADFEAAIEFGHKSAKLAKKARDLAMERSQGEASSSSNATVAPPSGSGASP